MDIPESSSAPSRPKITSFIETEDYRPKTISRKPRISFGVREDVNEVLKGLTSWSFDIFELKNEDLPKMVERIFEEVQIFDNLPLDRGKFFSFVTSIQGQYRAYVPYHNFRHACDVLHATYLMLTLEDARIKLNDLETFALLLAALCHDVDHPGLNNVFLSATNDPLAIRYNDLSILESHHASTTMKTILAYEATNILESFSEPERRYIRKIMITVILATDMDQHFKIVDMLNARNSDPSPFEKSPPCKLQQTNRSLPHGGKHSEGSSDTQGNNPLICSADCTLLMQMIIKCADISNVMKPFSLSKRWAALLATEWFRQGEAERKLGLPVSKNMDPENPAPLQAITLGCIDFIAKPMYESMAVMLPRFKSEVLVNLNSNKTQWTRFDSPNSTHQVVAEILETIDPEIVKEILSKLPTALKPGSQKHLSHIQKISFNRANRTTIGKGTGNYSSGDHNDNGKQVERPLSLLISGTIEEGSPFLRSRPSGARGDRGASSSVPRNSEYIAPLKVQDLVSKGALHENRLIGNGKMFPHPDKGIQSLELVSKTFSIPFDSSTDERRLLQERNPLAVQVPHSEISFWKILRSHPRAVKLNQFMDSKYWALLIVPAVIIALFCHSLIKAFFPKAADPYLIHIYLVCLSLFIFEIVVLSVVRKDYFLGLSFWLDVVGSVTLIPLILGMLEINLIMARAAEAAKSFTKAAKWMQTMDFSKTLIISSTKLLKHRYKVKNADMSKETDFDSEYQYKGKPSQVWTRLSELMTQKLVLGMLLVVVLIPNLRINLVDLGPASSLKLLDHSPIDSQHFNNTLQDLYRFYESHGYKLLYLGVKDGCIEPTYTIGSTLGSTTCSGMNPAQGTFNQIYPSPSTSIDGKSDAEAKYRTSELLKAVSDSGRSEAYFSIKKLTQKKLQYDMATTIIILIILSAWSFFLSWDSNKLLIQPIERMVRFVKELAEDPVSFAGKMMPPIKGGEGKAMETRVVEAALIKIARLTKVALGDAGMDILSVNLKGTLFNPMIPGKKIRACFGFCDIRNFTDATECLQEDVMVFVNKIADLVHNKVIAYHGYPNKNIGDAFLLVWKKTFSDAANKKRGSSYADRALRSFLDIIYSIETSQILQAYAMHPDIQRRMPGYRIRLGFGLHVGWAIEGAIGSSHKVDPSYLSPHVNMASRLEAATKQYGVPLLLSETVVSNLTKSSLRDNCRKLDRITVKGSAEPMMLYTYDMPMFQKDLLGNYKEYKEAFEDAVDKYIDGEWHEALEKLQWCLTKWPTDFPITVLVNYMAGHKNMVPENWKGYRELHEK